MTTTTLPRSDISEAVDSIQQIDRWFKTAVPKPNKQNISAQLGVHFEEITEMLLALRDAAGNEPSIEALDFFHSVFDFAQRQFKEGSLVINTTDEHLDRVALLDALCDQIVTSVGVAHVLGLDIIGALSEVAASNDSKFNDEGKPIFNEQMKIMKGPNYFAPDLRKYT